MKKALSTICVYDRDSSGHPVILSLTVLDSKGGTHYLITDNDEHPYKHENFADLYCDALRVCNSNGFKVPFIEENCFLIYKIEFITMEKYSAWYASPVKHGITMRELQHYILRGY